MPLGDAVAEVAPDADAVAETVALIEIDEVGDTAALLDAVVDVEAVLLCDAETDTVAVFEMLTEAVVDAVRLFETLADTVALLDALADGTVIKVYIALKLEPRVLYGATSAPRNAYDCWLASACCPELSYVVTRTATLTKLSVATSGDRVAVNTPPEHTPFNKTPTAVFPTLVPTATAAPWLALVLTADVLLLLSPTSN